MTGRAGTRAAGRDKSSSVSFPDRTPSQSQSPVKRSTRATRSQSRDLSENDAPNRRTGRPRGQRQGSEEGVEGSSTKKSRREKKIIEATAPVIAELSIVAEDDEIDQEPVAQPEHVQKHQQSPGAMSNMSGTTALTSHSMQEIADLDPAMIVNSIPDLYDYTIRLQKHLMPSGESLEARIESWKQFQVPGSRKARSLRYLEKLFESSRENYGNDRFINVSFILRKLFKDDDLDSGDYRPDVVFQAANVVILLKSFLIIQQDNPSTLPVLQLVDDLLPRPFFNSYESNPQLGTSALLHETFDLALALRVQVLIACLKNYKGEPNYNPEHLLVQLFYDPPNLRDGSLEPHQDSIVNGKLRRVAGIDPDILPIAAEIVASQEKKVIQVINSIREAFNHQPEAIADDDLVDFEFLEEKFPWSSLLALMVKWSQSRMDEIQENIAAQNGIGGLVTSLAAKVQDVDSQIELNYELPHKSTGQRASGSRGSLLPAAEIMSASIGKNFYKGPDSVQTLMGKSISSSTAPPSNQMQRQGLTGNTGTSALPRTPGNQTLTSKERATAPAKVPTEMRIYDAVTATDNGIAREDRSTTEILEILRTEDAYKNKENNPVLQPEHANIHTKRFVDRQENAERVQFSESSQETDEQTNAGRQRKRSLEIFVQDNEDESEISEDEGFQQDAREVDTRRRNAVVSAQGRPPAKRTREENPDDEGMADQIQVARGRERRQAEEEQLQQSAANEDEEVDEDREIDNSAPDSTAPQPTPAEANAVAKIITARSKGIPKVQQRIPWSEQETNKLIELIESHGCSWTNIIKLGRLTFKAHRDQVALKDKARNIKVDYLKAGAMFPVNFNGIALSKKEIEKVKAAGRNPYRLEGEEAGDESIGLDGLPVDG